MKVAVLGLWHLGCVTAACVAQHFEVTGLDFDAANVARLQSGHAPLAEPGLDALIVAGLASGQLRFTDEIEVACADADILWVTYDTPVNENDQADIESVLREVRRCVPALPPGALVLLSSQLPVGTCKRLENEFGATGYRFACSPENLQLGQALDVFSQADRVIVGCRDERAQTQLAELFAPFTHEVIWMRPESAEMTKHAINSFLAVSITFMNEVARLCEATGADAKEVERGLKSESRIGPKAYLSPGGAFAGGTLARDVVTLSTLGQQLGEPLEVLPAIKRSNDRHRQWAAQKLSKLFAGETGRRVALLGLTYKPGTSTLRRSSAVELARSLAAAGFEVHACDPSQPPLPADLDFINFKPDAAAAVAGVDAVVVCTEWPEFRSLDWSVLLPRLRRPLVLDAARFLAKSLAGQPGLQYVTVGSPA
ncbi:MAG: nucleotide sugar dehydrogenase [Opitutaceae bacterium]